MSIKKGQLGFSLVELLSTIAVSVTLAGVSMAVYVQYQDRAYLSASLQQGVQLRTAFEAGLSGQSSLGSSIFNENRNFQFQIDGSESCDNCSGYSFGDIFVGFSPQRGVGLNFSVADTQSYTITAAHCRNAIDGTESADGWIVSDEQASVAAAISMAADHLGACSDVLAGGDVPAAPSCGDGTCNGSETAGDCPDDCPENCGDGYCTHTETTPGVCPADCGGGLYCSCGDSFCDSACSEDTGTCPDDCGYDGFGCGDGECNGGESCYDCPDDCGGAPDACGVCGGDGSSCAPVDCFGVPWGGATTDDCGVCGGDSSSCADCNGVPNGPAVLDACGVCDGDGTSC